MNNISGREYSESHLIPANAFHLKSALGIDESPSFTHHRQREIAIIESVNGLTVLF